MWFFVCEGYYYTRDVKKYMLRLAAFAVIFNRISVMYPLFIAIVVFFTVHYKKPSVHYIGSNTL